MLGKLDEKVKNFHLPVHRKRGVLSTVVAIAAAKALIQKSNEGHLKVIELEKSLRAKSLFQRMGFPKRAVTTGKPKIPEGLEKKLQ